MSGREDVFQKMMNQGHSAAWDQAWERAAGFYRQALEEFPDRPQALTSLGLALFEMQDFEESLRYYALAAKAQPEEPLSIEKIAQIYEQLGKIESARSAALQAAELYLKNRDINKAIENWKRVTRLQPGNLHARTRLAMVFEHLGKKEEAASEYLVLAALFQHAGDQQKTIKAVNQALLLAPGKMEVIEAAAALRENRRLPVPVRDKGGTGPLRKQPVRQLEAPRVETAAAPADPISEARQKALTALAGILFDAAADSESDLNNRRGLQALIRGGGSARSADRARVILHLGAMIEAQTRPDFRQAMAELERALEAGLEHPAAYFNQGFLYQQADRQEEALKTLQLAVHHPDFSLGAHLLMAQIHEKQNELRDAAVDYMHALSMADAAVLPDKLADELRRRYEPLIESQLHETNPAFQRQVCQNIAGLLLQPDWKAQMTKARAQLAAHGEENELVPLAEVLTQARSSQVVESLSKIRQLDESGSLRSAMEEAFYALEFAPTYLPLHTYMGEMLLKQGQVQEAIKKFLVVAQSYSTRGDARRAIQLYKRVIELSPMDMGSRTKLINELIAIGEGEEALNGYMDLAEIYYNLADLERARNTYEEALKLAQNSRVERSWQVRLLHRMADIDLQSLDWRKALRMYEQIRTVHPDDERARVSLIDLNSRLGQDERALAELDNYLVYLAGKGQRERAVKFLETIVNEDPNRTWARRRLAELYQALGRRADAIAQWDMLGDLLIDAGDIPAAMIAVEAILSLKPDNASEYETVLKQLKERASSD